MSEVNEAEGLINVGFESPVTALFPTLFEPKRVKDRRGKETGDPIYSISLLLDADSEDLAALKKKAVAVAKAKWPGKSLSDIKFPFLSGDKEAAKAAEKGRDGSFYEGKVVLKAKSKFAPAVVDGRRNPPALTTDTKLIYSGCGVAAELNLVAYDAVNEDTKDGVTCYLNSVCFVQNGPRIASKDHAAVFRGLKGRATDEDPTAGVEDDDEIPF